MSEHGDVIPPAMLAYRIEVGGIYFDPNTNLYCYVNEIITTVTDGVKNPMCSIVFSDCTSRGDIPSSNSSDHRSISSIKFRRIYPVRYFRTDVCVVY